MSFKPKLTHGHLREITTLCAGLALLVAFAVSLSGHTPAPGAGAAIHPTAGSQAAVVSSTQQP